MNHICHCLHMNCLPEIQGFISIERWSFGQVLYCKDSDLIGGLIHWWVGKWWTIGKRWKLWKVDPSRRKLVAWRCNLEGYITPGVVFTEATRRTALFYRMLLLWCSVSPHPQSSSARVQRTELGTCESKTNLSPLRVNFLECFCHSNKNSQYNSGVFHFHQQSPVSFLIVIGKILISYSVFVYSFLL